MPKFRLLLSTLLKFRSICVKLSSNLYADPCNLDFPISPIIPIWIDTDIALGANRGDVDDGFAIAALLNAAGKAPHKIKIVGFSIVDGNTDPATSMHCLSSLINLHLQPNGIETPNCKPTIDNQIPVMASGSRILALGPLTNVAAMYRRNPEDARKAELLWVGGVLSRFSLRRKFSDLNVRRDPDAAALALKAFPNAIQFPIDVIDQMTANAATLNRIAELGPIGRYISHHSRRWLSSARVRHGRSRFPVWDLVPALYAIDELPSAKFNDERQLIEFDPLQAWNTFEKLITLK
jgi:inosine-uridine nucleoside N-ribohydrolase